MTHPTRQPYESPSSVTVDLCYGGVLCGSRDDIPATIPGYGGAIDI